MVLVVDNSAEDRASNALEAAVAAVQLDGLDFAVYIMRSPSNLGFARGVNAAIAHDVARNCDAILLLNNDAALAAGTMESLIAALNEPGVDLVAPVLASDKGNEQPVFWYQRFLGIMSPHPMPYSFPYLSGCCLLLRRDLLEAGKLLDEDFFMYGEDILLGWRLQKERKVARHVKHAVVHHVGIGSSQQCELFYEYHTARAHVLLAWKTYKVPLELPLLLIGKGLGLAMRAVVRSMRFRSLTPLLAFCLSWFPLELRTP